MLQHGMAEALRERFLSHVAPTEQTNHHGSLESHDDPPMSMKTSELRIARIMIAGNNLVVEVSTLGREQS